MTGVQSDKQRLNDDEIDLKELFLVMWQGKFTIISTTILIAALAIAYALSAKQVWTAEAIVTSPQLGSFSDYQTQVRDYQPIFDIYQQDGTILVSKKLDDLVNPGALFTAFMQNFDSRSNKKEFLEKDANFQKALLALKEKAGDDLSKRAEAQFYSTWYKKLSSAHIKGSNEDNFSYTIKGESSDSEASYRFLLDYIKFVESKTKQALLSNLNSMVVSQQSELAHQQAIFSDQAKSRLNAEKERAEYALQIAEAAGISKPLQNLVGNEIFAINIGADALKAKVKVLHNLKNLSLIDPRLEQVTAKLQALAGMKVNKNIQFQSFQYIVSPETPISRTSPKRPLIAILGVLLGGMLGVAIVLIRHAFRKK